MNHALLKSVIYDQHEFIRNFQIVPRDYEFEENGNYVLVGLRRAGKSTLLYKIVLDLVASGVDWEQIIYINFEDERLSEFTVAGLQRHSVGAERDERQKRLFLSG
jgi:predicted AAA+ superfamily ATPase